MEFWEIRILIWWPQNFFILSYVPIQTKSYLNILLHICICIYYIRTFLQCLGSQQKIGWNVSGIRSCCFRQALLQIIIAVLPKMKPRICEHNSSNTTSDAFCRLKLFVNLFLRWTLTWVKCLTLFKQLVKYLFKSMCNINI